MRRVLYALSHSVRRTGQSLEQVGVRLQGALANRDALSRHKCILTWEGHTPKIGTEVFVAPSASVIGQVSLGEQSVGVVRRDAARGRQYDYGR